MQVLTQVPGIHHIYTVSTDIELEGQRSKKKKTDPSHDKYLTKFVMIVVNVLGYPH